MRTLIVEKEKLEENTRKLKEHVIPKTKIIAVVKCNGYGLGAVEITKCLIENGIEMFAVSTVEEALELRNAGIKNDILMLSCTAIREDVEKLLDNSIILSVGSNEDIQIIEKIAEERNIQVRVHLKIDTGMGRYGFVSSKKDNIVDTLKNIKNIKIEGTFSHFSSSYYNERYTKLQFKRFLETVNFLKDNNIETGMLHICNSAAFIKYPEMHLDAVRIGSAFLGRISCANELNLKSLGYLETKVTEIKEIEKGSYISYSNAYKTKRKTKVAIVPCGYTEGFNLTVDNDMFREIDKIRNISSATKDLFKKEKIIIKIADEDCEVLGRVGTHHIVCDITNKNIKIEDNVIMGINPKYVDSSVKREYI